MRHSRRILGIAAVGITALAVTAAPALAANGSVGTCTGTPGTTMSGQGTPGTGQGYGRGQGMQGQGMQGQGMQGQGMRGQGAVTAPMGTLTSAQKSTLVAMAEEEKLAHDLYVALAARFPAIPQFSRIAQAESMHLTAVRTVMARYGIADPTLNQAPGEFSPTFQTMYDDLLAGATSTTTALAAGVAVEKEDIADLKVAMTGLTAPDVLQVYTSLLRGSERHLAAFSR